MVIYLNSKSEGVFEVNFSNELPLESQLKYFISNMEGKIEKANGDSAVDVMKVFYLASKKSLIGRLKIICKMQKKNFCS